MYAVTLCRSNCFLRSESRWVVFTRLAGAVAPGLQPGRSLTVGVRTLLRNRVFSNEGTFQFSESRNETGPVEVKFTSKANVPNKITLKKNV